jgi:P-type Ca2+ transporter type 2C
VPALVAGESGRFTSAAWHEPSGCAKVLRFRAGAAPRRQFCGSHVCETRHGSKPAPRAFDSRVTMEGKALKGLSSQQALATLATVGPNALQGKAPRSLFARLWAQLQSALIYVLLFALLVDLLAWVIAGAVGVPLEALAIFGVVLLNAALGVLQEFRSERALLELGKLGAPRAWVLRDDCFEHIDASSIVPGDIVRLEAGDRVPADGVTVQPEALNVDESVLTGESVPVEKNDDDELLSGTLVSHGRALLRVQRTGTASNMGKLAATLGAIDTSKTPLERRVDELGRHVAQVVGALCLLMVVGGFAAQGLSKPLPILRFAVAFGVAVVPEGLPAMMTLALAFGVQRMARRRAVVRRLAAVEALGSVTVIATDKTGTLTENRLTVEAIDVAPGKGDDALRAMVLANDSDPSSGAGDPLELALVAYATQRGTDAAALHRAYPRLSSRGFDSHWRCMRATVVSPSGEQTGFLKGAPEAIVARCRMDDAERAQVLARVEVSARRGFKVIGLAKGPAAAEEGLAFVGLVSLWDPPRPEAKTAVAAARGAGVRVLMLTGDHAVTARTIARAVGIDADTVVEGSQLGRSDVEVDAMLRTGNVFARMQPQHKLRLIERLQASMFPARRLGGSLRPNAWIAAATALSVALQLACVVVPPVQRVMGLVALAPLQLAVVGAALLATLLLGEAILRPLRRLSNLPALGHAT